MWPSTFLFFFPLAWPSHQPGYPLKLGIPAKRGPSVLFKFCFFTLSSLLGSWQPWPGSFLCALSLAAGYQGKFNCHRLPSCLPATSLWYSHWHPAQSRPNNQNNELELMPAGEVTVATPEFDSRRQEFRCLLGFGVGLDIDSSPSPHYPIPFMWLIIIFPAYAKCSSHTTSSQPFKPNCLSQTCFRWKY